MAQKRTKARVLPFVGRPALTKPPSITVAEAARRLGCTTYRVDRLIEADPTFPRPHPEAGSWRRVDLAALEAWVEAQQAEPHAVRA